MLKKVFPLSAILSLRFLGLFLVLPLLSVYAIELEGATPFLVGVIVGGYALTQAIFQVPFGTLSDKFGRKPAILFGLILFMIGSLICALSESIYLLMLGRFLQGAGAIGSVIPAMVSDLVPEEIRGKAMAIMGASIGISFALAMGLGPVLGAAYGVDTLFFITAFLALVSMIVLYTNVPNPPKIVHTYHERSRVSEIIKDKNLLNMILINAMQKALMSISFVLIPLFLTKEQYGFGWESADLYKAYLPAMIFGLLAMGPAAVFGEKRNKPREIFLLSIILFVASYLLMGFANTDLLFIVGVVLFFVAFNMMEPLVQSMVTKFAKVHQRGAAVGISNTAAYLATFFGATFAGILLEFSSKETMALVFAGVSLLWLLWTLKLSNPPRFSHLYLPHAKVDLQKLKNLESEHIAEWYENETEGLIVIKYAIEKMSKEEIESQLLLS